LEDKALKLIGIILLISVSLLLSCASTQTTRKNLKIAKAYFNLGTDHLQEEEYDEAIAVLNKALELNPKYAEAYLNRGIAYKHKNQHDQAISDYSRVLEIDPKDARAYCNRGNIHIEKGRYDQAISDYTHALRINPRDASIYYNRGIAYSLQRDDEKSWEDMNRAKDLGYPVSSQFLDDLRKALEKEK
jgi:tetratricopeptide (TPR) repeat protein